MEMTDWLRMLTWSMLPLIVFLVHAIHSSIHNVFNQGNPGKKPISLSDIHHLIEILSRSFMLLPLLLCVMGIICVHSNPIPTLWANTTNSEQLIGEICLLFLCIFLPMYLFMLHWVFPQVSISVEDIRRRQLIVLQTAVPYAQWIIMMPLMSLWRIH